MSVFSASLSIGSGPRGIRPRGCGGGRFASCSEVISAIPSVRPEYHCGPWVKCLRTPAGYPAPWEWR
eukprot:2284961-Prorocentrum_lima.AAC.1